MKAIKHNLVIAFLFGITVTFAQTKTKKYTESFKVNNDVVLEINAHLSDVTVEYWDKNEILVESVLSVEGVTDKEAEEYFEFWNIEALGNSSKVVVNSNPSFKFHNAFDFEFGELNIEIPEIPEIELPEMPEMEFEPVIAFSFDFDSLSYPSPPEIPTPIVEHMHHFEWDQEAYEADKEKYLAEWERKQAEWEKEFEEKHGAQMAEYEKEMKKWEKEFEEKYAPEMEKYEKEMKQWEKS